MVAFLIMIAIIAFARVFLMSSKKVVSDQVARALSERSAGQVRGRLKSDLSNMSAAEARGYVRARALGVVRNQAHILAAETGQQALPDEVVQHALERTVHLVVRQWMTTPAPAEAVRAG